MLLALNGDIGRLRTEAISPWLRDLLGFRGRGRYEGVGAGFLPSAPPGGSALRGVWCLVRPPEVVSNLLYGSFYK